MENLTEKRQELYGPERNVRFQNIRNKLTRSHVLQDGEYNFTNRSLGKNIWNTSHSTDFSGASLDPSLLGGTSSQLTHHFEMGNMSGKHLDKTIYRNSTTQEDFDEKGAAKPKVSSESKTVNWPDMAPQLRRGSTFEPSEYISSFITNLRGRSAPSYPRVNTSKLKLPLDPSKFWRQRNTNFSLGSDDDGIISEQQRVYGRGERAYETDENEKYAAGRANKQMKNMDKVSHVFRLGDYNDIVGDFVTTCNNDFGPRTVPPGEAALQKVLLEDEETEKEENGEKEEKDTVYANINQLQKFARDITVPAVFKDASDGRTYQTGAHFEFGTDEKKDHSIYAKDYALSSMVGRNPPMFHATPNAGRLLQNDPNQSQFGKTSSSVDFQNLRYLPFKNSKGKTAMEMNLDLRDTDNVILSFDLARHLQDRQKSLNHIDFVGPPRDYKTMELAKKHEVIFDYLQTDEALPYPPPLKDTSEASHNFSGMSMHGPVASSRRAFRKKDARQRWTDGRTTHFVVGYTPFDFSSETKMKFRGDGKNDQEVSPAGSKEIVHPVKFHHLSQSQNTLDLKAADPHITSTRESLRARLNYAPPPTEPYNTASIMKKDYGPLGSRSVTEAQMKIVDKYDKLAEKDIAQSHFFHTDTSGRNNFVSTAMDDFTKPEKMTGRKYLAAR